MIDIIKAIVTIIISGLSGWAVSSYGGIAAGIFAGIIVGTSMCFVFGLFEDEKP